MNIALLYCAGDRALSGRLFYLLGDLQKLPPCGPGQPALSVSAWAGTWTNWPPEVPSLLWFYVILCDSVSTFANCSCNWGFLCLLDKGKLRTVHWPCYNRGDLTEQFNVKVTNYKWETWLIWLKILPWLNIYYILQVNMSAEYRDRCCKNKKHEHSKVFFCNDTQVKFSFSKITLENTNPKGFFVQSTPWITHCDSE